MKTNTTYSLTIKPKDYKIPCMTVEQSYKALIHNGRTFGYLVEIFIANQHSELEPTFNLSSGPDITYNGNKTAQVKTTTTKEKCFVTKSGVWDKSNLCLDYLSECLADYYSKFDYYILCYKKLCPETLSIKIDYQILSIEEMKSIPMCPDMKHLNTEDLW